MWIRRLIAAVALLIVATTELAPHHHPELTSKTPLVKCDGPTAGVPHLHPMRAPQRDGCLACFRQHMQLTISKVTVGTPQILVQFALVTARVAHARTIRLRHSSRAPPLLAS